MTVADNGLAYISVAELAGREWSGRALGVQNTVQNIAAVGTAPVLAAVIGHSHYALGFALAAIAPAARDPAHARCGPNGCRRRPPRLAAPVGGEDAAWT